MTDALSDHNGHLGSDRARLATPIPVSHLLPLLQAAWSTPDRQVAPDAALREASGRRVSGPALLARVEEWASAMRTAGIRPGDIVGIHLARSADQVAALFAALSLGVAYVPLDRSYPVARLRFMIDDLGLGCVAGFENPELRRSGSTLKWIEPPPWGTSATSAKTPPAITVSPPADDLAYVIYTSGSTGNPKGVRITDGNLRTFLHSWDALVPPERRGTWLALTSLSFDPSVVEVIWTLTRGWPIVLAPDQPNPGVVGGIIERDVVTHLQCTPTRASMLLADPGDRHGLAKLEHLLVGGEALTAALARDLRRIVPRVTNIYGPTETTVWAFAHDVADDLGTEPSDPIPIGRPLPGVRSAVVDEHLYPVADGVLGELLLAGDDVADGYHARPDQTTRAFIETCGELTATLTFGSPSARVYRTGDLVRRRTDGVHEFAGRIDDQIKVSGNRIEPAEVESVLLGQPGVEQAVVAARRTAQGIVRLVAYIRGAPVDDRVAARLREACAAAVPPSHVPSLIVGIDRFPLTPSGKIDRRSLPDLTVPDDGATPAGTRAETAAMCQLWSSVLGAPVSPDDDYFTLGGDSLTAVAIVAEIARRHDVSLGLAVLVSAPTPRLLVDEVHRSTSERGALVLLRQVPNAVQRLVLVHGAGGNVVNLVHSAKRLRSDIEAAAFQAHAVATPGAKGDLTIEAMATRYLGELRSLQHAGPYLLCGYSDGGLVAWDMARQLLEAGESVRRIILLDTGIGATRHLVPPHERLRNAARNVRDRQRPMFEFLRDARAAQRAPRTDPQVSDDDQSRLGRVLDVQAEVEQAVSIYRVRPLALDVSLIRSRHTPVAVWSDFRWRRLARNVDVSFVSGHHLDMVGPGRADELAAALNVAIAAATAGDPASGR